MRRLTVDYDYRVTYSNHSFSMARAYDFRSSPISLNNSATLAVF